MCMYANAGYQLFTRHAFDMSFWTSLQAADHGVFTIHFTWAALHCAQSIPGRLGKL